MAAVVYSSDISHLIKKRACGLLWTKYMLYTGINPIYRLKNKYGILVVIV